MDEHSLFKTYKDRGEWVELRFMTRALEQGYHVSKPWAESSAYDDGIEHGSNFLRVQVKSTSNRTGTGYLCQFKPNANKKQDYTVDQIDFFAAYIIPVDAWYLIPAALLLVPTRRYAVMLFPMEPLKKDRYQF